MTAWRLAGPRLAAPVVFGVGGDVLFGDPRRGHPVALFGAVAAAFERVAYRPTRLAGAVYAAVLVGGAAALGAPARARAPQARSPAPSSLWVALGGRSLAREAAAVGELVARDDLPGARRRIRSLVGRDPEQLDAAGLSRAVVESVAENTVDAVIAPLVWLRVGGRARGARAPRGEHARRDGRQPQPALRAVRDRGGAHRRCHELAGGTARGGADGAALRPPGRDVAGVARRRAPRTRARTPARSRPRSPARSASRSAGRWPTRGASSTVRGSATAAIRVRPTSPARSPSPAASASPPRCSPPLPAGVARKTVLRGKKSWPPPPLEARMSVLIAGTASDAGKSVITAAICRWLTRQGLSVAPFKAQNMALNSTVTASGAEIGRAQAMQAAACGIEPEAAMNPVLIKPSGRHRSQVLLMGKPYANATARSYQDLKPDLREPVIAGATGPQAPLRRRRLRGRGQPGGDQPARERHRQHGPRPRRRHSRSCSSVTSIAAGSSPRSTGRSRCSSRRTSA